MLCSVNKILEIIDTQLFLLLAFTYTIFAWHVVISRLIQRWNWFIVCIVLLLGPKRFVWLLQNFTTVFFKLLKLLEVWKHYLLFGFSPSKAVLTSPAIRQIETSISLPVLCSLSFCGAVPMLSPGGSGRPGLLFTAVMVVTTVPQGMTVRSISTLLLEAGVGGCQDLTSLGSR